MTIVETTRPITGGVDTHADVHVAAAVDANGGVLGVESLATTPNGFAELHGWLARFGPLAGILMLMDKAQINPWTWQDQAGFSQAWKVSGAGSVVFVAGQAAISADGEVVGEGDFDAQVEQVFQNLRAVLEQAGADFSAIVKITVYLTDITKLRDFRQIKAQHMPGPQPASTAIAVSAL